MFGSVNILLNLGLNNPACLTVYGKIDTFITVLQCVQSLRIEEASGGEIEAF